MPDQVERDIEELPEFAWLRGDNRKLWYSTTEIAEGTGISYATILRRAEAGKFPGARWYKDVGWKIPYSGIVQFLRDEAKAKGDQQNQAQ